MFQIVIAAQGCDFRNRIFCSIQQMRGVVDPRLYYVLMDGYIKKFFVKMLQIRDADIQMLCHLLRIGGAVFIILQIPSQFDEFTPVIDDPGIRCLGEMVQIAELVKEGAGLLGHNLAVLFPETKMFNLQIADHVTDFFIVSKLHGGLERNIQFFEKAIVGIDVEMDPVIDKIALSMAVILWSSLLVQKISIFRHKLVIAIDPDLGGAAEVEEQIIPGALRTLDIKFPNVDVLVSKINNIDQVKHSSLRPK